MKSMYASIAAAVAALAVAASLAAQASPQSTTDSSAPDAQQVPGQLGQDRVVRAEQALMNPAAALADPVQEVVQRFAGRQDFDLTQALSDPAVSLVRERPDGSHRRRRSSGHGPHLRTSAPPPLHP